MQRTVSSSCRATPTKFYKQKSPSHSSYKLSFILIVISLILLSTLTEAAPFPNKRNENVSIDDLTRFANYAAAAYCKDFLADWKCGPLCDANNNTVVGKLVITKKTATQVFIASDDKEKLIVVSFRGTVRDNIKTVITDAKIILSDYPPVKGTKVHTGFYKAFLDAQSEVFDEVQKLHKENPDFKVVYTGHSLGAALTLLSALDLVQNSTDFVSNKNLFVFTFGEPRVGDLKFSKYVDSQLKVSRVVNGPDPVPHLPPQFIGYEHHSGELFISNPKKSPTEFNVCNGPEDPKCSDSIPVIKLNASFHPGPYFGISMDSCVDTKNIIKNIIDQLKSGLGNNLSNN